MIGYSYWDRGKKSRVKISANQIQLCLKIPYTRLTSKSQDLFNTINSIKIDHGINKLKEKKICI